MAIMKQSGILTISVDTRKVENMLNGYQRTIPKAGNKAAKKIAGMYADRYLQALHRAKVQPWTGASFIDLLQQRTNPIKLGKGSYGVAVRQYLIALDSMRPHFVSLKRGRSITRWAKQKLGITPVDEATGGEKRVASRIFVKPHPWLRSGNISAGKNVRAIAEFEISKAIKAKGR